MAGDFNQNYPQFDEKKGRTDTHFNGQPALLYRAEIEVIPGRTAVPLVFGKSSVSPTGSAITEQNTEGITSALEIFPSIRIKVVQSHDPSRKNF